MTTKDKGCVDNSLCRTSRDRTTGAVILQRDSGANGHVTWGVSRSGGVQVLMGIVFSTTMTHSVTLMIMNEQLLSRDDPMIRAAIVLQSSSSIEVKTLKEIPVRVPQESTACQWEVTGQLL